MIMRFDKYCAIVAAAGVLLMGSAHAFNVGNMMNPSQWMGGNNSRDRGGEYYGGPGYGGGPDYGGPPGYGGGPDYGGGPGYGYGGAPGYGPGPGYFGGQDRRDSGGSNPMGMMPNPMKMFGGNKN